MSDETTTEQLAEIEAQTVEPEPEPVPVPVQVREGRWKTRGGEVVNVTPSPPGYGFRHVFPWHDARALPQELKNWRDDGHKINGPREHADDLVEYLGPIEQEPQPDTEVIEELRSEVSYVQRLLGKSRQRVTQLEELVTSLRTINEAQEKSVRLAGQANTDLQHRLDVVSAEWAEQVETVRKLQTQLEDAKVKLMQERLERNRWHNQVLRLTAELDEKTTECRNLRIELDALQQAPQAETVAVVPTSTDGRFEEGWDAGTARAVETIAEWTEPFRRCGSQALALAVMANLPHIMRTLTGLTPED